ncbi:fumarylacetoacetate hydrolase family protein [Spirillospora sp. NPDC048819]|uniref:fumarylacetoacetate hydrolase family protein n=1 Tax=Spirillospora sp. NPDC048819 TaxID=3155268 RepID=UPI0033F4A9C6
MKLITFDDGRVGRLDGEDVIELDVPSTRAYFEREGRVGETGERLKLRDVRLRAPIRPKKFFHTAGNFADHHEELQAVNWSHPVHKGIVFFQNVDAIIGPDDPVVYPEHLTKELDYELELAVIIGKPGKFFGPEQALEHIAGFTVFNDITARDIQRREMESGVFSFSKAIDTFCPIGPWIVTADEIGDMQNLAMELRVNGETRQTGHTKQMRVSIPHLVAYHSPQVYSAGDILTTGTVSGVAAVQPDPFGFYLRPGDVVEAEIEGVGLLRNPVVSWRDAYGEPAPERVGW